MNRNRHRHSSLALLAFLLTLAAASPAAARVPAMMGDRRHALVFEVGAIALGDTSLRAEAGGGGLHLAIGEAFGAASHPYYRVALATDLVHGIFHPSFEGGYTWWFLGVHAGLGWRSGALWVDPAAPRPGGPALHGGIDILIPIGDLYDESGNQLWLRIFFEGGGAYRSDDGNWTGFGQGGVAVLLEDA